MIIRYAIWEVEGGYIARVMGKTISAIGYDAVSCLMELYIKIWNMLEKGIYSKFAWYEDWYPPMAANIGEVDTDRLKEIRNGN